MAQAQIDFLDQGVMVWVVVVEAGKVIRIETGTQMLHKNALNIFRGLTGPTTRVKKNKKTANTVRKFQKNVIILELHSGK